MNAFAESSLAFFLLFPLVVFPPTFFSIVMDAEASYRSFLVTNRSLAFASAFFFASVICTKTFRESLSETYVKCFRGTFIYTFFNKRGW